MDNKTKDKLYIVMIVVVNAVNIYLLYVLNNAWAEIAVRESLKG